MSSSGNSIQTRRGLLAVVVACVGAAVFAGPASAAFPGLNGKIAVSRDGQIVVKNPGDLSGGTPLTSTGANSDPEWSPDGLRIVFVSDRTGSPAVWTMNADGSGQAQFSFSGDASSPSWSPDGTRLAYAVSNGTDMDVVTQPLTGGLRITVAGGPQDQDLPVWTPDGSKIVFNDDAANGLSIVGATGAGRAPFLSDAAQADFSPDGGRIIVSRTDIQRLQIVAADGSGGTSILDNRPAARPVWSPDGSRVLYQRFVSSGPPPNYDLFTVSAAGGGVEVAEATPLGLDFGPDWQAIGPPPVVSGFPVALTAGAPGATLTVDGTGFVRRSVVRWNGADRPTAWVSTTRVTATLSAADVARPGTAQVTVFTPPSGGGLSAARPVTIPAPPPPPPKILLGSSKLAKKPTWSRSRVTGAVVVAGSLERAGRVEVAFVRRGRVAQKKVYPLAAGAFSKRVPLTRTLVPGTYTVRLREVGATGTALVGAQGAFTLAAPPEGVVTTASVSALQNGPPARTLRDKSRIFATFRFVSLPKGGRAVTTTWKGPGIVRPPDGKPRRTVVSAFLKSRSELPAGVWRCELRVGGKIVAVATVRLK